MEVLLCNNATHKQRGAQMTKEEFISYAHELLSDDALEPLYDQIAEHNSEVARFGDSWPGALVLIQASVQQVLSIERQLARLEGREVRDFHFRVRCPS